MCDGASGQKWMTLNSMSEKQMGNKKMYCQSCTVARGDTSGVVNSWDATMPIGIPSRWQLPMTLRSEGGVISAK
eukprot:scaffold10803_cov36-Tisochrysis_lutea.AAC.5